MNRKVQAGWLLLLLLLPPLPGKEVLQLPMLYSNTAKLPSRLNCTYTYTKSLIRYNLSLSWSRTLTRVDHSHTEAVDEECFLERRITHADIKCRRMVSLGPSIRPCRQILSVPPTSFLV